MYYIFSGNFEKSYFTLFISLNTEKKSVYEIKAITFII